MIFNGNLRLEMLGEGRMDGRTDVWKFTPVSYRTSALWGRCPNGCKSLRAKLRYNCKTDFSWMDDRLVVGRGVFNLSNLIIADQRTELKINVLVIAVIEKCVFG